MGLLLSCSHLRGENINPQAAFSLTDVNYNIPDQSPVLYLTYTLTRLSYPKISFKLLPCGASYFFSMYISF